MYFLFHFWNVLLSYFSMHFGIINVLTSWKESALVWSEILRLFVNMLKCAWNLEHFEYPILIISEIMDCERAGYLNV